MPHEPTDSVKDSLPSQNFIPLSAASRQCKLLWAISLFALLVGPMPALSADCVQPSSDVVDGVTIRAAPKSSGALRGKLKPGEQLPLIASVPNWYETRLSSGKAAFVSKRWTDIVACASVAGGSAAGGASFELHAIDVGTGLAVLVRGADFSLLFDAGSNDDVTRGAGNRVLAYFRTLTPGSRAN